MIEKLPVNQEFPAEPKQSKLVLWIQNQIYRPIARRINWFLDFFTATDDGDGGEFAPGFGPVSYIDFDITYMDGQKEGRLQWNVDDGTLEVGMPGGAVNLQIGQEMLVRVTNDTGSQIDNGTPVYISSASGTNIKVTPADADFAGGIGLRTFAVATEDIAGNQKGYVATQGFVRDIDTSFAAVAGLPAYLAVGGGLTTTKPTAPDISYLVGIVTIAHASNGELYVIQTSIPNLSSLSDVSTAGLVDATPLQWDSGENIWAPLSTWRDELNQLIGSRLESPSSNITQNNIESSVTYDTNTDLDDYVTMNVQFNHDWDIGTDVHPHIHWWQEQADIPNWMIEYRWQINGAEKTTTWTPMIWQANAFTYAGETSLDQITGFAPISPPVGAGLSDIMQIRLIRDNDNDSTLFAGADPVAGDVDAVNLDVHIEVNTLGSKTEFSK